MNVRLPVVVIICLVGTCQLNLAVSYCDFLDRIKSGDMSVVEQVIEDDHSLFSPALSALVTSGDVEVVRCLLVTYQVPADYRDLLKKAVFAGQLTMAQFLLLEMSERFSDIRLIRNEALKIATLCGKESIVKWLLQLPEDQRSTIQLDDLVLAAVRQGHVKVFRLLLRELSLQQQSQDKAMIKVAQYKQWYMTAFLLQQGAANILKLEQQQALHAFLITTLQEMLDNKYWLGVEAILQVASPRWTPKLLQDQMRKLILPAIVHEINAIALSWHGNLPIALVDRTLSFVIGPNAYLYYSHFLRPFLCNNMAMEVKD